MQTIQLNQIAHYLPYDLEFKDPETVCPGTMVAIVAGMPGLIFYEDKDDINYFDLHRIKPLLIPLSQLTKAQWFSILMQGLHQTTPPMLNMMPQFIPSIEFHDDLAVEMIYTGTGHTFSYSYKEKQFESHGLRFNNLAVIEELYKIHADVDFLIDAGLALNKLDHQ